MFDEDSILQSQLTVDCTQTHARMILIRLFGEGSVLDVAQKISEQEKTRVLSSDELRVKSLADKAKRLKQQEKELKARNALTKAQKQLAKASTTDSF